MANIPESVAPGTVVGGYVVQRGLASGGMGDVYVARHQILGTLHALKFVRSFEFEERTLVEARLQALIDSRFVVPVNDVLEYKTRPVLVMPLVEGCSLAALIRQHKIAPEEADFIVYCLLMALGQVHALGVVHRDVKPHNVLLDVKHGDVRVKLSDFGIAKVLDSAREPVTEVIGTPEYAPPEQLEPGKFAVESADMFALGVLVYELVAHQRPFPKAANGLQRSQQAKQLGFGDLEGRWGTWLPKMLDPDAERRPSAQTILGEMYRTPPPPIAATTALADEVRKLAPVVAPHPALERSSHRRLAADDTKSLPRPHNLPRPGPFFEGREELLGSVAEMLDEARLVSLLGPGGVGKTELAMRVGWHVLSWFSAGVWLCDLRATKSADQMHVALARVLDVEFAQKDAVQVARRALAARGPCLVILDNVEQLLPRAASIVQDWIEAAPEARFLVTTQAVLDVEHEQQVAVEPLSQESAVALYASRARRVHHTFDLSIHHDDVAELVEHLDRLPLAIGLAAGRVRMLSPKKALARLKSRDSTSSAVLTIASKPTAKGRHDALTKTIEWSWELLQPWAQSALAQLSVFFGGFDLEAFEEVVRYPPSEEAPWPMDALQWLVERSLVQAVGDEEDDRFTLLNSVRAFSEQQRQQGADPEEAPSRHAVYYGRLGGGDALTAIRRRGGAQAKRTLVRELENLVGACEHALRSGDAEIAVRTGRAAWQVFSSHGPMRDGLDLLERITKLGGLTPRLGALLWCDYGEALRLQGRPNALPALERAKRLATQVGDARTLVLTELRIGWTTLIGGDLDGALPSFQRAASHATESGDVWLRAEAQLHLGQALRRVGRPDEAIRELTAAAELATTLGDRRSQAAAQDRLAALAMVQGRFDLARVHQNRAVTAARAAGHRRTLSTALTTSGVLEMVSGRFDAARGRLEEAHQRHRRAGDVRMQAFTTFSLAYLDAQLGQEPAQAGLAAAAEQFEALRDPMHAEAMTQLALLELNRGRIREADVYLAQAQLNEPKLDAYARGHLDRVRGLFEEANGRLVVAGRYLSSACKSFAADPFVQGEGIAFGDLVRIAALSGDKDRVQEYLGACEEKVGEDPNPLVRCLVLCARAYAYLLCEEKEEVAQALQQARALVTELNVGQTSEVYQRVRGAHRRAEVTW